MRDFVKETLLRFHLLGPLANIYRLANPRWLYHNVPYLLKKAPDGLPIPPLKLRSCVWREYIDLKVFFQTGGQIAEVLRALESKGARVGDFREILDFGCGVGRVVRQFAALERMLPNMKLYATDINLKEIEWGRRNLPFAEFQINQAEPPLDYGSEAFDFIYTFSVFTHLSESQQLAWMAELRRVLKPGGYLLLTTCGESYFETLTQKEQRQFHEGRLTIRHAELAGIPSVYGECIAFHPRSYVETKLTQGFELIHFIPGVSAETRPKGEMDYYFLRKPVL
ncbi:MAG: class I SAM-dependent methyltransferase [Acidobacteriota bacterium]|nr:class I SAM-dependent methyltransferase [Acidobacteriota bacterium]